MATPKHIPVNPAAKGGVGAAQLGLVARCMGGEGHPLKGLHVG